MNADPGPWPAARRFRLGEWHFELSAIQEAPGAFLNRVTWHRAVGDPLQMHDAQRYGSAAQALAHGEAQAMAWIQLATLGILARG